MLGLRHEGSAETCSRLQNGARDKERLRLRVRGSGCPADGDSMQKRVMMDERYEMTIGRGRSEPPRRDGVYPEVRVSSSSSRSSSSQSRQVGPHPRHRIGMLRTSLVRFAGCCATAAGLRDASETHSKRSTAGR